MKPLLILFVHGLGATSENTWGRFRRLIDEDDSLGPLADVKFFGFKIEKTRWSLFASGRKQKVSDLANGLRTEIDERYRDYSSIVLVGHSLGGLIIRQYLVSEVRQGIPLRANKAVLFAVPNNGSEIAAVAHRFSLVHTQLADLTPLLLESLNYDWRDFDLDAHVDVTHVIAGLDEAVREQSAVGLWGRARVRFVADKSHSELVAVADSSDLAFLILRNAVLDFARRVGLSSTPAIIPTAQVQSPTTFAGQDAVNAGSNAAREATSRTHVVLLLHGIRTLGEWQDVFEETANRHYSNRPPFHIAKLDYGVYAAWKLLIPFWWRRRAVSTFVSNWQSILGTYGRGAQYSIIAHSFGTYILYKALVRDRSMRFHSVILTGSLMPRTPDWSRFGFNRPDEHVNTLINDIAVSDRWVLLGWFCGLGMGLSGLLGFRGMGTPFVNDRRFAGDHSDLLVPTHFTDFWFPMLERNNLRRSRDEAGPISRLYRFVASATTAAAVVRTVVLLGLLLAVLSPGAMLMDHFFRRDICSAWPWRMPLPVVKACVAPLNYEETTPEKPPSSDRCSESDLRNEGWKIDDIAWHRITFVSSDSDEVRMYRVRTQAWTVENAGWMIIASQPHSPGIATSNLGRGDIEGWEFVMGSGSTASMILCASRVPGARTSRPLASSIGRRSVAQE